jgi:group I intron endonuclease
MKLTITLSLIKTLIIIILSFTEYNFYYYTATADITFCTFVPVMLRSNAEKSQILKDNKGATGIYLWTHLESGKKYVGPAFDLSQRISYYFSKAHLARNKSYIYNALRHHGYSSFSLTILNYIDTTNLSKDNVRSLLLQSEQHYLDTLLPEYNILKKAGSSLGYEHRVETLDLISKAIKGRPRSEAIKEKISIACKGRAKSDSHRANMCKKLYVYTIESPSNKKILFKCFDSYKEAAQYFDRSSSALYHYADKNKLYKKKYLLSTNEIG